MTTAHVMSRPKRTPVIGGRIWSVVPAGAPEGFAGPVLRGAYGQTWTGPVLTAECRPPLLARAARGDRGRVGHASPPPHPACDCGIYALKPQLTIGDVLGAGPHIVGSVEMSGMVLEGTRGYRGQQARIVGPLELRADCDMCTGVPTAIADSGLHYAVGCELHSDDRFSESLEGWLEKLEHRYGGPILVASQWELR